MSGFIPADINLFWHSIAAQLDMITVLPGLWLYAKSLEIGKRWTQYCLVTLLVIVTLNMLIIFIARRSIAKVILFSDFHMGHCTGVYFK